MRWKKQIMDDLNSHVSKVDPQHYELAAVAMIETEIQVDIRDILNMIMTIITPDIDYDKDEP